MKKYSFDEVMDRLGIIWDCGKNKGLPFREEGEVRHHLPNMMDIARIGAVIMRLEDEVKRLKRRK